MGEDRGRYLPLSLPRRWVGDLLYFSRRVPLVAAERPLRVAALDAARRATPTPPGWAALLIKGVALVGRRIPELRRAFMPFPWPRLYESPTTVASVVIDRVWRGEHAAFISLLPRPDDLPLGAIQHRLNRWRTDPVEQHGAFRRLIRNSRFPLPVRRALWAFGLYASGPLRARYFGTFAISSVAASRGRVLQVRTPITSVLYYGPVSPQGEMTIQYAFDHRVFDAYTAGRIGSELETILNDEVLHELKRGPAARAA